MPQIPAEFHLLLISPGRPHSTILQLPKWHFPSGPWNINTRVETRARGRRRRRNCPGVQTLSLLCLPHRAWSRLWAGLAGLAHRANRAFGSRSNLTANSKTQTTVQFIITLSRPTSCPSFMHVLCKSPHLVGLTEAQLVFSLKHIFQNCTQSHLEKRKYQLVSLGIFFSDSVVSPVTVVPLTTLFTTEMFSTHYCLLGLSLFPHLAVQS